MEFFWKYSGTQGKLKLQVARHPEEEIGDSKILLCLKS